MNLASFKIMVLSIQIKTKSTTILKEMRFAQLASKNERTLVDYILLETKLCSRNIRLQLVRSQQRQLGSQRGLQSPAFLLPHYQGAFYGPVCCVYSTAYMQLSLPPIYQQLCVCSRTCSLCYSLEITKMSKLNTSSTLKSRILTSISKGTSG